MRPLPRTLSRSLSRGLSRGLTAAAAGTLAATLVAGPAVAAKPAITLTPGSLDRGPDVTVPHLDGHTVVDGSVRVPVHAPEVRLLGKSGTAYVVGTTSEQGGRGRIYRLAADGTKTLLAKAHPFMSILSDDGGTLVTTKVGQTAASTITVYDVATATRKDRAVFGQYGVALDAQTDRIIIGTTSTTKIWTISTGNVKRVSHDPGYVADLDADVVGTFTEDPYDGGCSEVRRISSDALLWRSCTEQVAAFNADASRIATIGILSDGPGPGRVDARTISGKHLGRYKVRSGWFGEISWESPTALLMEVNGARKAFTARCTRTDCERASDLRKAEPLRTAG
jgi:hypothetical protein